MIDESIIKQIIPIPDEEEKMEEIQNQMIEDGFPLQSFKKGGIMYHLTRLSVKLYIELLNLARTILHGCYIRHAESDWLEIKAADFSKYRKEAQKTKGYVTIYRTDYENAMLVTKGHCFKTKPDVHGMELKYYVLENTVIDAGQEIGKVLVEAEKPGTAYNIPGGRITESMIYLDGVDRVINESTWLFEEGADAEDLEDLRTRLLSSWSELSTHTIDEKLKNRVQEIPGVLTVRIDSQHPRGQGTVDIIITSTAGTASEELIRKVTDVVTPLQGQYADYLVKSSEVIQQDIRVVIWLAEDAAIDGVKEQAENILNDLMQLNREEINSFYRDSIINRLSTKINGYRKTDILVPEEDVLYGVDKVIVAGEVFVEVKNVSGRNGVL